MPVVAPRENLTAPALGVHEEQERQLAVVEQLRGMLARFHGTREVRGPRRGPIAVLPFMVSTGSQPGVLRFHTMCEAFQPLTGRIGVLHELDVSRHLAHVLSVPVDRRRVVSPSLLAFAAHP